MTRYFEVKVTGCKDCPYARHKTQHCNIPMTSIGAEKVYTENKDQLTRSCPMSAHHKTEGEVLQNIRNLENNPHERI